MSLVSDFHCHTVFECSVPPEFVGGVKKEIFSYLLKMYTLRDQSYSVNFALC